MPFEFSVEATHPPPPISEGQRTVSGYRYSPGAGCPCDLVRGQAMGACTPSSHPSSNTDGIE